MKAADKFLLCQIQLFGVVLPSHGGHILTPHSLRTAVLVRAHPLGSRRPPSRPRQLPLHRRRFPTVSLIPAAPSLCFSHHACAPGGRF